MLKVKKILILILMLFLVSCGKGTEENNTLPTEECTHDYVKGTIKSPTCKEEGLDAFVCNLCGDTYEETVEVIEHEYENNSCIYCGSRLNDSYLYDLFGEDIEIYTSEDRNPYGINLKEYGSNVKAYIYEPNISVVADPYANVSKDEFYQNYKRATSYEDAYYRTKHNLMSGDITDQYYLPNDKIFMDGDKAVRISDATYVLDSNGNYLAYIPNVFNAEDYIIFYGAAYTSLNDVAAYLLAFGEVPANQVANKNSSGQRQAIATWGKYGRVNDSRFSGDTSKYPYEPELPKILGANSVEYHEIDFGTTGGYKTSNSNGYSKTQVIYNTGTSITRGAARIVYVADDNVKNIDERYVFYTYTHYNDFQEYLNYHDGWGIRFGNESAGNEYCSGTSDYREMNCVPPTQYPTVIFKKYNEVK